MIPDKTRMSPPWEVYARKVEALFAEDDDVYVVSSKRDDQQHVDIYVSNPSKFAALRELMPVEVEFGNVTLHVQVVSESEDMTDEQLLLAAFAGNPALASTMTADVPGGTVTYALFEPEVVQIFCDDISSPFGVQTLTYEQIARDVFGEDTHVLMCSGLLELDRPSDEDE